MSNSQNLNKSRSELERSATNLKPFSSQFLFDYDLCDPTSPATRSDESDVPVYQEGFMSAATRQDDDDQRHLVTVCVAELV